MKRKGFLIEVVLGTEYERMSVIDPRTGSIVFEGSTVDAMQFLTDQIASFKNSSENEGK